MIDAIWSDIPLQIVMVAIATVFAAWAVWHQGSSRQLRFTIAMLQALVFESSLVLLASAAFPNLFQSLLNRQGLIAMVAMEAAFGIAGVVAAPIYYAYIKAELSERLLQLEHAGKKEEAQRLHQRTMFDLEMMKEIGYCHGIENYSRHLSGRSAGEPPPTLLDYLPEDAILIVDESHQTVPQVRGMYAGDRARKEVLVEYGFRLPSALDNRPLNFKEWESRIKQAVYVSATPGPWELKEAGGVVVEQIIRPTGLVDPTIDIRPVTGQIDDLLGEIRTVVAKNERVLVTTLTKKMSEDLTTYYQELGVRVRYLHSDIETLERIEILRDLRLGNFDVLVGINLLREGLDLPEVSLVAILDADKEGFLRSAGALIQTMGRAARNVNGRVVLYADRMTDSMKMAIGETDRRRAVQQAYNVEHGITPASIIKNIDDVMKSVYERDYLTVAREPEERERFKTRAEFERHIAGLEKDMRAAAANLEFERAAQIRDRLRKARNPDLVVIAEEKSA